MRNHRLVASLGTQKGWLFYFSVLLFLKLFFENFWRTEAATRGVLYKKMFLNISQNSQESKCARVPFLLKLQGAPAILLKKKETLTGGFRKILRLPFLQNTLGDCFSKGKIDWILELLNTLILLCKIV